MAERAKIRCRTIIEILGKPKEHVEKTLKEYVDKIKEDESLVVLNEDFAEPKEQEGLWSVFAELEMILKDIPALIGFCFDYMPSSIEIIKPEEIVMTSKDISDFMNDLQARLHKMDMLIKQHRGENDFLRKNMNVLVKNIIMIALAKSSLSAEKLSKAAGIPENEILPFIKFLLKENKLKKEGEIYSLA